MKTTGLEAVLSALRGEGGLSGADKTGGSENPAFLAAFDAAARSAAQRPEASGAQTATARGSTSSSQPFVDGSNLPDGGSPSPEAPQQMPVSDTAGDSADPVAEPALNASPFVQDALEKAGAVLRDRAMPASGGSALAGTGQNPPVAGRDGPSPQNSGLPQAERPSAGMAAGNPAFTEAVRTAAAMGGTVGGQGGVPGNTGRSVLTPALASAEAAEGTTPENPVKSERPLTQRDPTSKHTDYLGGTGARNGSALASSATRAGLPPATLTPGADNPMSKPSEGGTADTNPRTPAQRSATVAAPSVRNPGGQPDTLSSSIARDSGQTLQREPRVATLGIDESKQTAAPGPLRRAETTALAGGEPGKLTGTASRGATSAPTAGTTQNAPRDTLSPHGDVRVGATPGLQADADRRAGRLAAGLRPEGAVGSADNRFELPPRTEVSQEAVSRVPETGTTVTPVNNAPVRAGENSNNASLTTLPDVKAAPDSPDFPQEILGRLRMMQGQNGTEARLNLHPAELGRLQIAITSEGDATRVAFVVDNAQAKEALEQAMPRLREFLAQAGLQLAEGTVSQQSQSNGFGTNDGSHAEGGALAAEEGPGSDDGLDSAAPAGGKDPDRIVDAYA